MDKEVFITPTEQHIIDQVRRIRLEAGLTQKKLSQLISPSEDSSMIGKIESVTTYHKYTDHNLNIIAKILKCTIYEFYPEQVLSDTPQRKTVLPIPKGLGPTGVITLIIESREDYLKDPLTTKQITALSNSLNKESRPETDFTAILARFEESKSLKRIEEIDENNNILVKYQKI